MNSTLLTSLLYPLFLFPKISDFYSLVLSHEALILIQKQSGSLSSDWCIIFSVTPHSPCVHLCVYLSVCVFHCHFYFLFLIYCIRFQHLSLHPIILWFIFIVPTLFSQQPPQHLHVTLLTEGCVFAGHRVTANRKHWISPLINCGKKEFPLPLSSSEGVYVCVRVHTRVPKFQESLRHHPARTLTQQASLSLYRNGFVYILEEMHFFLIYCPDWLVVHFFFQLCLFFQDFYIVLMTDNKNKSYFQAHLVVHLQTFREIFHFHLLLCFVPSLWSLELLPSLPVWRSMTSDSGCWGFTGLKISKRRNTLECGSSSKALCVFVDRELLTKTDCICLDSPCKLLITEGCFQRPQVGTNLYVQSLKSKDSKDFWYTFFCKPLRAHLFFFYGRGNFSLFYPRDAHIWVQWLNSCIL